MNRADHSYFYHQQLVKVVKQPFGLLDGKIVKMHFEVKSNWANRGKY